MNVRELIKTLKNYPPDMEVILSGYEGGYDNVTNVTQRDIKLDVGRAWYYGKHAACDRDEEPDITALLIY